MKELFGNVSLNQILIAAAIVVVFISLAWLARFMLVKYVKKFTRKTKTKLDNILLAVLAKPLIAIVVLVGLYIAALIFPRQADFWSYSVRILGILLSLLGIYLVLTLINTFIRWYRQHVAQKAKNVGLSLRLLSICWIVIILAGLWLAVIASMNIWGLDTANMSGWLGDHGWRIALIIGVALLVVVSLGEIIPRVVVRTLSHRPDEKPDEIKKRSDTLSKVLVSTLQIFMFLIAVFMILSELEIDIAPILASAGVVGIAIGFGAQSMVKDIFAGLFIVIESQYRVGDVVKIADVSGVVENINLRRTILRDIDGIVHVIPHGEIRVASNYTKEWARVNLNISVAYGENLDHVMEIINKVGDELTVDPVWGPMIIKPPQALRVDKLGDSGIDIKILGETQPTQQWAVMGELRLRLKKAFDAENIEIPWPHTKVYFSDSPLRVNSEPGKTK